MRKNRLFCAATGLALVLGLVGTPQPAMASPKTSCADKADDRAAAVAMAKSCGRRVEALAARTESSLTFANPDGTATMEMSAVPKRFSRADGSWADVDTTLQVNADGSVSPMATSTHMRFSGGGSGALVAVTKGTRQLTLSWPDALPAPILTGDSATYPDVLPEVDLVVRATSAGFTHVLVVKSATAAKNPALRTIDFALGGTGITLTGNSQGGVVATGADGVELMHSGGATMWDSSAVKDRSTAKGAGDGAREAQAFTKFHNGRLSIEANPALLTGANTTFPLYIDPAWHSPVADKWAYSNSGDQNNTTDYARVGHNVEDGHIYRSFFRFPVTPLHGATIMSASFEIMLYHSWSCGDTPAYAWRSGTIASTPRTAWSPALSKYLDSDSESANKASCYTSATPTMSFDGDLASDLQAGVNASWADYTIAVTTRESDGTGESTQDRWKKFFTDSAYLKVQYNHVPNTPQRTEMSIDPSHTCGATPVIVNANNGLTLRTSLSDKNNDNVAAQWSVSGIDAIYAPKDSAAAASGTEFSTFIPAAAFLSGTTYSWTVRGYDGTAPGAYSPSCSFTVDNSIPGSPSASSTELALGTGLIVPAPPATAVVGAAAHVTIVEAPSDTNIAGYLIGVGSGAAAAPSIWVPAGSNGDATAPVVPVSSTSTSPNYLTIKAINLTGQSGGVVTYKFKANPAASTPAVRNDATGDGKPDVTVLADAGGGRSALWRWDGRAAATVAVPTAPQDIATTYTTAGTINLNGDFDGDGLSDVAMFHSQGSTNVTLSVQRSNGNGLLGTQLWASDSTWAFSKMKAVAGNFDGDSQGRTDIAVLHDLGGGNWRMWTFVANGTAGAPSFAAPAIWHSYTGGYSNWAAMKIVAADFNGDGKADILEFFNRTANSQTQLYTHVSSGSSFGGGSLKWDSGAGNWGWEYSSWAAGDFNADGREDVAAVYRFSNCKTGVYLGLSGSDGTGPAYPTQKWLSAGGDWCQDKIEPFAGDVNGDGKADLISVYRCCGLYQIKLHAFVYNGSTFNAPSMMWEGGAGPLGSASLKIDTTATQKYLFRSVSSGECLTAPGASVADGTQLTPTYCIRITRPEHKFTITRVGPGSNWIHMTYSEATDRCIETASLVNGAKIQQNTCNTTNDGALQYFMIEYRSGFTELVVRLVNRSAGTCIGLTADNALIQNSTCNGGTAQDFRLIPVPG